MIGHVADDLEVRLAFRAMLLAVLDGECHGRAHVLLYRDDDPRFAINVAHHFAHAFVDVVDDGDRAQLRADIAADLLELAAEDPPGGA